MSAINGVRKSGTDRRSGVDRRELKPSSYQGAERRGERERRHFAERRDRVFMSTRASRKKPNLLDLIFRKKFRDKKTTEGSGRRARAPRSLYIGDAGVIMPRSHERLPCDTPVQILDRDTHSFYPGVAHNYCTPGMYLESKHAPRVGSGVVIEMINHTVDSKAPDDISRYYSKVVWLKKMSGNVVFIQYGMGVKHCRDLDEFLRIFGL